MGRIDVVVGGQFGSEGKGHVTQQLVQAWQEECGPGRVLNVRVAGPNAGHTVYTRGGMKLALRQVPVGVSCGAKLAIAAGSEVDPYVLLEEVHTLRDAGLLHEGQLTVHPSVTLISELHHRIEARDDLEKHGSTIKGVGAARAARLMRQAEVLVDNAAVCDRLEAAGVVVKSTERLFREWVTTDNNAIVLEGTQGYGLGLHSGYYPYTTSSDCRAVDFLAMAGINPWWGGGGLARGFVHLFSIWVVLRPYPIRIAGNSGPLRGETTWDALGLPEEITTVTRKTRRVGAWDPALAAGAVAANGGPPVVRAAFTMLDQVFPGVAEPDGWTPEVEKWVQAREEEIGCQVGMATLSPTKAVWL